MTHECLHGAVKSMSVVPSELGVGALERRVSVSLGLLDTTRNPLALSIIIPPLPISPSVRVECGGRGLVSHTRSCGSS